MPYRAYKSLAALTLAAMPAMACAQPASPSPVAGWDGFIERLRTLPERMLATLPPAMQADPQVRQEVARLALEALAEGSIDAIGGDADAPQFLPMVNDVLGALQPNADTIYRSATISGKGSYRITGRRGTLTRSLISQILPGAATRPQIDLKTLHVDQAGRFDLLLSPSRPAGYSGDWWALDPATSQLMVRTVSSNWSREQDPTLSIERVDQPIARRRASAATLEARLNALPKAIEFLALVFVDHVAKLEQGGIVNRLVAWKVPFGSMQGQFYYEGAYDLADDEALIVSSPVPAHCLYRSLILTNEIFETTDWVNNQSSLNADQAAPDPDGKLRIVVSARDPGVRNWLDTAGYPRGVMQGRWTQCDSQPIPEVTKVKLSEVRQAMPAGVATVTSAERQAILRERRRAFQERPRW